MPRPTLVAPASAAPAASLDAADAAAPQYGTEHDAARLLGLSPQTLRTWRARRVGPTCWRHFGRAVRYDLRALALWAAAQPGDARHAA